MLQLAVWQQHGSLGQGLWTFLIINTVSVPILSVIVCPLLRLLSFWLLLLWLLYITYHHYCHSLLVSNVFYVFHWCFSTNTACSTRNGESIRTESKRARLSCRKDGCHDIRKVNSRGAAMRSVVRGHVSTFNALRDIRPSFSMAGIPRDAPQLFFCFKIDSVKIWGLPDSWSFGSFSGNRRVIPDFFFRFTSGVLGLWPPGQCLVQEQHRLVSGSLLWQDLWVLRVSGRISCGGSRSVKGEPHARGMLRLGSFYQWEIAHMVPPSKNLRFINHDNIDNIR